jgi:hypothetical protein
MFANSGQLPRGIRTVSPDAVAEAVARAIEHDRGEVDVAPIEMKVAALLGGVLPELAGKAGETSAALVESAQPERQEASELENTECFSTSTRRAFALWGSRVGLRQLTCSAALDCPDQPASHPGRIDQ